MGSEQHTTLTGAGTCRTGAIGSREVFLIDLQVLQIFCDRCRRVRLPFGRRFACFCYFKGKFECSKIFKLSDLFLSEGKAASLEKLRKLEVFEKSVTSPGLQISMKSPVVG